MRRPAPFLALIAVVLSACATPLAVRQPESAERQRTRTPVTDSSAPEAVGKRRQVTTTTLPPGTVLVEYRIENRSADPATHQFAEAVRRTLAEATGWARAGFFFRETETAPHSIILAEGPDATALCHPINVWGKYSCQNATSVVINADRWRNATAKFTGDLAQYHHYLINHEVGHLLGQPHQRCPAAGAMAPVMVAQSSMLAGCLPNGAPLAFEIEQASRHEAPLAPTPQYWESLAS